MVDYAARRFITVIPEIEFPGMPWAALASYPWLSCTGERYEVRQTWDIDDRVFCPGRESTFEFIEGVLSEVLELFPSEYIHIGGDECPTKMWARCGHCQARMRAEGIDDLRGLQGYATARVERFLQAHGRQLIGWGRDSRKRGDPDRRRDVLARYRRGASVPPGRVTGWSCRPRPIVTSTITQTEDTATEPLAWGGCLPLGKGLCVRSVMKGSTNGNGPAVLGVQANLWTEYIPDFGQGAVHAAAAVEAPWPRSGGASTARIRPITGGVSPGWPAATMPPVSAMHGTDFGE